MFKIIFILFSIIFWQLRDEIYPELSKILITVVDNYQVLIHFYKEMLI